MTVAAMAEGKKLFELDEKINLAGRITTLREQHQNGKLYTIRGNNGPVFSKDPVGHWAVVMKEANSTEQFGISEADFQYLRGQGVRVED